MNKLEIAREIINKVDKQMADLFVERMEAVKLVAEHKKEHGLPVLDNSREQLILERNSGYVEDDEIRSFYRQFMKNTMAVSRSYQHRLLDGIRVAYSGVEGAFAYIAAAKIFPDGNLTSFPSFSKAYESVVKGDCDVAVLPIENSYAGEVGQVLDLMFSGDLYVNGVYDMPIVHNLLAKKGTSVSEIRKVVSHEQALAQCANYIEKCGFEKEAMSNTAVAAKTVAECADRSIAAIASAETAELYGLDVLDHDINESSSNTTRFAVFSRTNNNAHSKNDNCFILLFTVSNTAGSLAKAIDIIGRNGFNMRVLRSHPMKELAWKYYFYVEAEGDVNSDMGKKMVWELSESCEMLKVVGNYSASRNMSDLKEEES